MLELDVDVDVDVEVPVPVLVARFRRMPILLDGVGPKADTTMDVSVEAPSTRSASKERGCIFFKVVREGCGWETSGNSMPSKQDLSLGSLIRNL